MSDDIIQKLRNAPRQPDCKHGNRPKSCLECDIEELEAEATASMTEIARLRTENERLRRRAERYREAWEDEKRRFTETMAALKENSDE